MLPDASTAFGRVVRIALLGLGLGVAVGGVLARLAMFVLARLNPGAGGIKTDEGFVIGQFTWGGTINLLMIGAVLGLIGGLIYAGVQELQFRPRNARILATTLVSGVGVGALVVQSDGFDFTLLTPTWLTVGIFVGLPALYGGLLSWFAERMPRRRQMWAAAHPTAQWLLRMGVAVVLVLLAVKLLATISRL